MSATGQRNGYVYLTILMTSLIVASLALAAVNVVHQFAAQQSESVDFRKALLAANSGLELAIARINADPNWRSTHVNNTDIPATNISGCSVSYRLVDTDGDLADSPFDRCTLQVRATCGDINYRWQATVAPDGPAMNCLLNSVTAGSDVNIIDDGVLNSDGPVVSSVRVMTGVNGFVVANCSSPDNSGNIYGTVSSLLAAPQIPGSEVFEYYKRVGTDIPVTSLPISSGSDRVIRGHLLSENVNTITGGINSKGIYVLDLQGANLDISITRVHGTLVLINCGIDIIVQPSVLWEPAVNNYPILLCDRDLKLRLQRPAFNEFSGGRNLNPPELPYRGLSDANTSTYLPCLMRGLIYATGKVQLDDVNSDVILQGCIVCGGMLEGNGDMYVHYRDIYAQHPPPGFRIPNIMKIVPGSVKHIATP
ncbi:MAG: hypothetical protein KDB03_05195 [Planctomycetales bacterium]|nr:hypothetical protein [Planctomycetales bacterium]